MRAPEFWQSGGLLPTLLAPFGWLFAAGAWLRQAKGRPVDPGIAVICVGNAVAGGAGKTPTVLALAGLLADCRPHALSRGYRGRLTGPVQVDPACHSAADVGDEPLLLARHLPTWIARDRIAGAQAAAAAGAGVVLMDDGFQDPSLRKSISLLVVDAAQGFGNGYCMPAGPLREPAAKALARADAVVLIGEGNVRPQTTKPVFRGHIEPTEVKMPGNGAPLAAFAGIGRPEKFFETLRAAGAVLSVTHGFPDHHAFSEADLEGVLQSAPPNSVLITTEKDYVRLPPAWRWRVHAFPVALRFDELSAIKHFLTTRLNCPD